MEILIKRDDINNTVSFICLIYGIDGDKDYYIKNYCQHNNIVIENNPINDGIYCKMVNVDKYLVFEKKENYIKNLYLLMYIQRSTQSPFHKEI